MDSTRKDRENQPGAEHVSEEPQRPRFYRGGATDDPLPELVKDCLKELSGQELTSDWRKRLRIDSEYDIGWPEGAVRSVRLPNGQTLWLTFDLCGIEVLHNNYSRTDLGLLGALTALKADEADVELIREVLSQICDWIDLGESFEPSWQDIVRGRYFTFDSYTRDTSWVTEENIHYLSPLLLDHSENKLINLAFGLIRYYRPEFDDWSDKKQCQFLAQACERINNVAKSLRQLAQFLEFGTGTPGEKLASAIKDAERDIWVLWRHDVYGLTFPEIREMLGIKPTETDKIKGERQQVRKMAVRARKLVDEALELDGGWEVFASQARRVRERSPND